MARAPRVQTGTPPGMQGVRPGSPAAVAAGYKPPKAPKKPKKPGGAPFSPSFNPDGTTTLTPPTVVAPTPSIAPPAAAAAPPPPPPAPTFQPTSAWWMSQLAADPRYMTTAPLLDEQRAGIGRSYGFTVARDAQGRPLYRTAAGATGITQQLDDKGAIIYRDAAGNTYQPGDLQLDIQRIGRGQTGYLSGQFGAAEAGSEARQYRIGEEAARAGLGRSGMRASTQTQEAAALQSALAGLTSRAGAELAGVDEKFAELYREIYGDLAKRAEELAAPVTAPEVPAAPPVETGPQTAPASTGPTSVAGVTIPQAPTTKPKTIEIAGQRVEFPKGINLTGVNVDAIGDRIVNNIRAAGGVGKLRNGQRVGEFRAGDKGYRVFYRNGRFVIELIG